MKPPVSYGSLFTGIGGLDLAVEQVFEAEPHWQCEVEPYCRKVLAKHWPGVVCHEDVRTAQPTFVDIICGGFPCQNVSSAGKGEGIEGPKSGLWREFVRIVRHLRPDIVIVENVTSGLKRWLPFVLGDLSELGFDARWETVSAAEVGAPHIRQRTFVLAYTLSGALRIQRRRDESRTREAEPRHTGSSVANANGEGESACPIDEAVAGVSRLAGHRWPPAPGEDWHGPFPAVRGGSDGIPHRLDRLRALGNAVVPQQAALALSRMLGLAEP